MNPASEFHGMEVVFSQQHQYILFLETVVDLDQSCFCLHSMFSNLRCNVFPKIVTSSSFIIHHIYFPEHSERNV